MTLTALSVPSWTFASKFRLGYVVPSRVLAASVSIILSLFLPGPLSLAWLTDLHHLLDVVFFFHGSGNVHLNSKLSMLCLPWFRPHPRKDVGAWVVSDFPESLLYLYEQLNIISIKAHFQSRIMQCVSKTQIQYACKVLAASPKRCWSQARRVPLSQSGFTQWRDDGRLESHQSSDAAAFSSFSSYDHKVMRCSCLLITFIIWLESKCSSLSSYDQKKWWHTAIFTNLSSHQSTYHHPLQLHLRNLSTSHQIKMRQLLKRDSLRVLHKC